MNSKNIAVFCFSPYWGGMEMDALRLWRKLMTRHVTHMVVRAGTPLHETLSKDEKVSGNWEAIAFSGSFSLHLISRLRHFMAKHNIHAAVFFGASEMWSLYFAFLGTDIRLIIRHGTTKSHSKRDPLHRLIYSHVYAHVTVSDHLTRNVLNIYPVASNTRIERIYPGNFPLTDPDATPNTDSTVHILHIGRIADGKGHMHAIHACAALWETSIPFRLSFAGKIDDDGYAAQVRAYANTTPYSHCITFLGQVTDVTTVLSTHDIFLFPSHGEGLSNALIEALGYGLVCIVFDNTVFPEFVSLGFYMHLVNDRDDAALSARLLTVASDMQTESTRAQPNIERVRQIFSSEKELDAYDRLFTEA